MLYKVEGGARGGEIVVSRTKAHFWVQNILGLFLFLCVHVCMCG
jgi:hypothetical protein